MLFMSILLLGFLYGTVECDYSCVCVQDSQQVVFAKDNTTEIGKADIGDCYPIVQFNAGDNVVALAYKQQVGYLNKDSNVRIETCAGDPYDGDALTTPKPTVMNATTIQPLTRVQVTTLQRTTTTKSATTTMQATTMQPVTLEKATMMQPTTMMENLTLKPATTSISTAQPSVTLSQVTLVNQGVCPQVVQEHASDYNNIIAIRGQTCYEVVAHRAGSWSNVDKDCQVRGGHLIDIASAEEQNFISELLSNNTFKYDVWIGLNDRHHEETFDWSSGNSVIFTNWLPGRKSPLFHGNEDCVFMSRFNKWQWDDGACSGFFETDRHFICKYRTVDPSTIVITTPPPSPDGNTKLCSLSNINHAKQYHGILAQYGHSCYELLPRTKYTWSHGESYCHSHGGHLAHISSAAEQTFIQGFMTRHSPTHSVWIGLHDTISEGHFEWTSGNPVAYLNWTPGNTDHFISHNVEDCVALIPYEGGKWDDIPCGSSGILGGDVGEKHPLLCQYNTVKDVIVG